MQIQQLRELKKLNEFNEEQRERDEERDEQYVDDETSEEDVHDYSLQLKDNFNSSDKTSRELKKKVAELKQSIKIIAHSTVIAFLVAIVGYNFPFAIGPIIVLAIPVCLICKLFQRKRK